MRVLIVHGFPPTALGGTELYARAHALALRDAGDDVVVLAREADPERGDYEVRRETREGLRIVWINNTFRSIRSFEETYRNDAIGAVASRVIDEITPDAAHVHHLTGLSTTIIGSLAERDIPCVLTLHDYWLMCHRGQLLDVDYRVCGGPGSEGCHACLGSAGGVGRVGFAGAAVVHALEQHLPAAPVRQVRRVAEWGAALVSSARDAEIQERQRIDHMREVCRQVTQFLAPSTFIRDRFVEFGVDPARIAVAANGVDSGSVGNSPRRSDARRSPGPLRLGFLGSLMISKAPHLLLEAASRLPAGSVSVDLFGAPGSYHGDDGYRDRLAPLLQAGGVRAHGSIAHDAVAEALASIDVLVVPSIWPENAPLVIQEAFVAGIPVVASNIGGIPEMVTDGQNGLLFRPGDVADLARALTRLIGEPGLLGSLRTGIPRVRSIEEDVGFARTCYRKHQSKTIQSHKISATSAHSAVEAGHLAAVVLNFRTPEETLLAVKSLLASRRPIDAVIVVNNDVSDGTRVALDKVLSKIHYIDTGINLGFSGGVNVGIREALRLGAVRVLLVNSDVIVPPDAVIGLERALDLSAAAGIAGPMVLARSEPDRIATLGISYAPATGRMKHRGTGDRIPNHGQPPAPETVDGVSGCLMLIKREVFERIGLFDEQYFFSFEDLDFCLKARRAGFTTILAGEAVVHHEGGQSLGARSPRRFYYAARNHLRLARQVDPSASAFRVFGRTCSIVALNLAHATISPGGSWPVRIAAVARGTRDYMFGRFGPG